MTRIPRLRSFLRATLVSYAGLMLIIAWIDRSVSEQEWYGSTLAFLPRQPFLIVAVFLSTGSLIASRRQFLCGVAITVFTAFAVLHLSIPAFPRELPASGQPIRLVSCNVQGFSGNTQVIISEAMQFKPDILVFQEARSEPIQLKQALPDWYIVWVDEFWFASRFPLRFVQEAKSASYDRSVGVTVEVDSPEQTFRLTNLHLMTPRPGLQELSFGSILDGSGPQAMHTQSRLRSNEAASASQFAASSGGGYPQLICGDLNLPAFSSIYRSNFEQYQNCYEQTNFGFGYTAPCNTRRLWPNNQPWVRIDHILATSDWAIESCRVGRSNGSDHRMIQCVLRLSSGRDEAGPERSVK